jgi:hypothetical protein
MRRRHSTFLYFVAAILNLFPAGAAMGDFTTPVRPPTPYPNGYVEDSIAQILSHRYGGTFQSSGSVDYNNGQFTAHRIDDFFPGQVGTPLSMNAPARDAGMTDDVWVQSFDQPDIEAIFAGFAGDGTLQNPFVNFGFLAGSGLVAGTPYTQLISLVRRPGSITPAYIREEDLARRFEEIPIFKPLRWGRGGGPPFIPPSPSAVPIPRFFTSKPNDPEHMDQPKDHMISYEITPPVEIDGVRKRRFLLCFEDLFAAEPSDLDYNDLVVEVKAEVMPDVQWRPVSGVNSGNWADNAHWGGNFPNAQNARAYFFDTITGPATVTLTDPISVNILRIRSGSSSYSFAAGGPAGSLTIFASDASSAGEFPLTSGRLNIEKGSHTFSLPITIRTNSSSQSPEMVFDVFRAEDVLTLSGNVTVANSAPLTIYKRGNGRLDMKALRGEPTSVLNLRIESGTLRFVSGGGTSRVNSASVTLSAPSGAKLDLRNNAFIVDHFGASPISSIRAMIRSAYHGGAWDGNGIGSSLADASHFALAYGENNGASQNLNFTNFGGEPVDNTSVLIRLMRFGDANLDGIVNLADFDRIASNFGQTGKFWTQGDFTYDGLVKLDDFNKLASNFGLSATGLNEPTPQDWANLAAAVPEPFSTSLALTCIGWMLRRREQPQRAD